MVCILFVITLIYVHKIVAVVTQSSPSCPSLSHTKCLKKSVWSFYLQVLFKCAILLLLIKLILSCMCFTLMDNKKKSHFQF